MLSSSVRDDRENRSPIVMPGYRKGQRPDNAGLDLPPEPLTRAEIERLLKVMGRGPCGIRNRALVTLMWRSGLRVSEALDLYPKDVDVDMGTVTVLRGKGRKRRQVAVDELGIAMLQRWMLERGRLGITGREHLFCCVDVRTRGKRMYSSYVRTMLKDRGEKAGIGGGCYRDDTRWGKRVHPHGLRHTMAFELIMEGVDLGTIRAQLGHSQLATTLRYCDHLAAGTAIRTMHARPTPHIADDEADGRPTSRRAA